MCRFDDELGPSSRVLKGQRSTTPRKLPSRTLQLSEDRDQVVWTWDLGSDIKGAVKDAGGRAVRDSGLTEGG